jgi:hypothetical protein
MWSNLSWSKSPGSKNVILWGFQKGEEMEGGEEREKEVKVADSGEDGESGELSSKKVNEDEVSDSGSDGAGDSDAEEELRREQVLREKLRAAKKKFGGSHVKTIHRTLKLVRRFPHQASPRWRSSPLTPSPLLVTIERLQASTHLSVVP